jgi:HSP20 family protein
MTFEFWNPNDRLDELRKRSDEMWEKLLADLPSSNLHDEPISFHPEVDLVETQHDFRFYLSIPGLVEDDIVIDVTGQRLTIRGERRPPYDPALRDAKMQEWRYGFFERHFELSTSILVENIRANYESGVLTIVAQKSNPINLPGGEEWR